MVLDPVCTFSATSGQLSAGLTCTATNAGADNVYRLDNPFGALGYTVNLLVDLCITVGTMTNPVTTGASSNILIETYVTDGAVDYKVDIGTSAACITMAESFYWDFTELTVAGTDTYAAFNTSTFSRMYLESTATPRQFSNFNSQGYIGEQNIHSMCTTTADASYNTGTISFTMYVYITDLTSRQYLYCKMLRVGGAMRRGF